MTHVARVAGAAGMRNALLVFGPTLLVLALGLAHPPRPHTCTMREARARLAWCRKMNNRPSVRARVRREQRAHERAKRP